MATKFPIDISQIRTYNNSKIENQIKEKKNNNDNSYIIRIKILKLGKTTISHNKDEKKEETYENIDNSIYSLINNAFNNSSFNNSYSNYHNSSDMSESTTYDSKSHIYFRNLILENINEKKFNSIRASFCIKYKFYDIPLAHEVNDFNYPPKYTINEKYFAFVYPNEILTYCITISGILYNDKINMDRSNNCTFGLYFCGEDIKIKIEDKIQIKKCLPHQFICKNCMQKNINKYNIKKKYIINLYGRVAKINKGSFHCFGHFLCGNQIEECITNFTCKACKLLDICSNYFLSK